MWGWIIKVTVISILLIFLLHYLYSFFKRTLTSPKLKDLVNKPQAKYNTIYNSIKSVGDVNLGEEHINNSKHPNNSDISNTSSMKDELKKYLKELNVGGNSGGSGSGSGGNSLALPLVCNDNVSVYSPSNIMTNVGANGISTRVNTAPNYMSNININKTDTQSNIDFATPNVSSSYSSPYSPY
jgi:hypothetical protein